MDLQGQQNSAKLADGNFPASSHEAQTKKPGVQCGRGEEWILLCVVALDVADSACNSGYLSPSRLP